MIDNPYGDHIPRTSSIKINKDMKSEDIGSGIRIGKPKKPVQKELSEHDILLLEYQSKFFVKNRSKNEFWIHRDIKRMCQAQSLQYNVIRNEFTRVLEHETAQVITIPEGHQEKVRDNLGKISVQFEEFLIQEVLPHSLALSSSLERATQIAQVVSEDEDISLDDKYIRMAHSDSMSLKTIDYFMSKSGIDEDIKRLYLEQFVMYRFGGQKTSVEKSIEHLAHSITKGQKNTEQLLKGFINNSLQKVLKAKGNRNVGKDE